MRRARAAILDVVPRRRLGDTKYSAGAVLVVGGQPGMTSAACLTALAALRADAGYVTLAIPEEALHAAEVLALEPVKLPWSRRTRWRRSRRPPSEQVRSRSAPGSAASDARRALVRTLLEQIDLPAVVDADALDELEPIARSAPDRAHAARGRARTTPRSRLRLGGRASARGRA